MIAANFTNFSGSGDWAHYLNYYFRPDGSLAKIEADLDTFYGNAIVERQFYFVKNGELIRRTKRVSDLKTHKPKKLNEDFIDEEVYLFKKVSKLPFASLLRN